MSPTVPASRTVARSFIPLALLLIAAMLANFGVSITRDAHAASTNVTVTGNRRGNRIHRHQRLHERDWLHRDAGRVQFR